MSMKATIKRMREKAPKYVHCGEAHDLLGYPGAMLSGSKQRPEGETVYWNACVFNDQGEQVWHGDLNLTRNTRSLRALADAIGTIHVTPENPFRWEGLSAGPQNRVIAYSPGGE